jgi:hypothetical protein
MEEHKRRGWSLAAKHGESLSLVVRLVQILKLASAAVVYSTS